MKFSAKEDVEVPIDVVFREASNFDAFERIAMRRGASVQRVARKTHPETTLSWDIEFEYRGKRRAILAELINFDEPNAMIIQSLSGGVEGEIVIDLVALSRKRTRLKITLEIKPKNLTARLLVQSLRLAKGRLTRRYKQRISVFAYDIEERFNSGV